MRKSTRIVIIIIASLIAIAAAVALGLYFRRKVPEAKVLVSGSIVDNDYNNYLAGSDFVRIGDKLYFNYYRNNNCYGLIEISGNGSQRIYWEGDVWIGPATPSYPLYRWNGQLYMHMDDGLYFYSQEAKQFEKDEFLSQLSEDDPYLDLTFQMLGDALIYIHYDESCGTSTVYSYDGEAHRALLSKADTRFYLDGTNLYYCSDVFIRYGTWAHDIGVYNLIDGTDTLIHTVPERYFVTSPIWVESGHILFTACYEVSGHDVDGLFKIALDGGTPSLEQICDGNEIGLNNVFRGKVYATVDDKLYSFDVITNKAIKLSDRDAMHCYIVDNQWIYFTEFDSTKLWRVTQSGANEEKVYG